MSDRNLARRAKVEVRINSVDISESLRPYLISLTYTDNEEDETDDLQITLHDRDNIWLTQWLNQTLNSAAESNPYSVSQVNGSSTDNFPKTYLAHYNCPLYAAPTPNSRVIGYLSSPNHTVTILRWEGEFGLIEYQQDSVGLPSYVTLPTYAHMPDFYIHRKALIREITGSPLPSQSDPQSNQNYSSDTSAKVSGKGLSISAVIVRQNWNSDGKDEVLDCGTFELDTISASAPPSIVTLKATSLPFSSSIRQTLKNKVWEHHSLAAISKEIAESNNMTCMYLSGTDPNYTRIEQYHMSDIALLKKLCHDAGLSLKITAGIIVVFDQAEYEAKPPVKTIKRGPDGGYLSYNLSTQSNDN